MKTINNQKGIALVTVLIITLILTLLGTTIWHYSTRDVLQTSRAEKRMQAYYLARSGADALAEYIIQNPDKIDMAKYIDQLIAASESTPTKLNTDIPGTFTVNLTKDEENNLILIDSIGVVDNVKQKAQLSIDGTNNMPLMDVALFSNSTITLKPSAYIIGDVGTNATKAQSVQFGWGTYIQGNLAVGPGANHNDIIGAFDSGSNNPRDGIKNGTIQNLMSERTYELPPFPDFPSNLTYRGNLKADGNSTKTIKEDGEYSNLIVASTLKIDIGDENRVIVADKLSVTGNARIKLNKTGKGKLYLYIKNEFKLEGSSQINEGGKPNDIIMYYKGSKSLDVAGNTKFIGSVHAEKANVNIEGSGGIIGHIITGGSSVKITGGSEAIVKVIYAPEAHVEMTGSGKLTGALIAKSFKAEGGSILKFDSSIMDTFPDMINGGVPGNVSYEKGLWR